MVCKSSMFFKKPCTGKIYFSKFDVTPNDIIKFQKLEIINLYLKKDDPQRKEK